MFDRLTSLRSDTALEVLAFLAESAAALDATPWTWPHTGKPIRATDVFVDLDVLTRRSERESLAPQSGGSQVVETDAARYELPSTVDDGYRLRWSQLMRGSDRHVLKGAPGSGKSFLSRHAAVVRLRQAHADLHSRRTPLADLPATLWVSAPAITDADSKTIAGALVSAAVAGVEGVAPIGARLRTWLEARLLDKTACVVVDAVDEVSPDKYGAFRRRLREIAELPGQLIVTCRTLQWELLKQELQPVVSAEEVELAPLTPVQLRRMIQRLFPDADAAGPVLTILHQNRGLRHACTAPLRLLLVCLLARDGRLAPTTTYAGLYTHLLRALIAGRWRSRRPRWTLKAVQVEDTIGALVRIGWVLFSIAPTNNRFNLTAWQKAIAGLSRGSAPKGRLLEDLVTLGVLVPAGFDELGDRCWSFAHRTLLEYLAARELASRTTDEWQEQVRGHFWFAPEWTEVLTFLASIVPDATPLLIDVDREEDDIFGSMLELRARLAGVARHVSAARARRVAVETLGMSLIDAFSSRHANIVPAGRCERCVRALGWAALGPWLELVVKWHPSEWLRRRAVEALGNLEPIESLPALVETLRNDVSVDVREAAAEALGHTGASEALAPLVAALRTDGSSVVRRASATALQGLGEEAAHPVLQALHDDPGSDVRRAAATAIAILAPEQAVDALMDSVCRDSDAYVRRAAADQLGTLGVRRAVPALIRALLVPAGDEPPGSQEVGSGMFPSERARQAIVRALGKIGESGAVSALNDVMRSDANPQICRSASGALRRLVQDDVFASLVEPLVPILRHDADPRRRRQSAAALGGFPGALDALVQALTADPDVEVRRQTVHSLRGFLEFAPLAVGPLRSLTDALRRDPDPAVRNAAVSALWTAPQATMALIEAMRADGDEGVRSFAAMALGRSSGATAIAPLLEALRQDPHPYVRDSAAEALGSHATAAAVEPLLELLQRSTGKNDSLGSLGQALGSCALARPARPLRGRDLAPLGWGASAAVALNNVGIALRSSDRLDGARTLLHAALSLDRRARGVRHPKVAHRFMNLASVELMRARYPRAAGLLRRAWSASPKAPDVTSARILTMRLIVALVQGESHDTLLGQLKTVLLHGSMSNLADVDTKSSAEPIVRSVQSRLGSKELELVTALFDAVNGSKTVDVLDAWQIFEAQECVSLDHPWESVR